MRAFSLLVTLTFAVFCLGAEQEPATTSPKKEPTVQGNTLSQKPQPKQMAQSHKPEPEYRGIPLSDWIAVSKSDRMEHRETAAYVLGKMGPAAIPALTELLKDKEWPVRSTAATALAKIAPEEAKTVIPVLTELLRDKDKSVRWATTVALAKMGPEATTAAVPALMEWLKDGYWYIRMTAAKTLGEMGPEAKTAIPALTELLKDEYEQVRKAAAEALKKIKGDKKQE